MADIVLNNKSRYEFIDISSEEWREYLLSDNSVIRFEGLQYLAVSKTGHRLLDIEGISFYIPFGWKLVKWKAKEGQPHFVK